MEERSVIDKLVEVSNEKTEFLDAEVKSFLEKNPLEFMQLAVQNKKRVNEAFAKMDFNFPQTEVGKLCNRVEESLKKISKINEDIIEEQDPDEKEAFVEKRNAQEKVFGKLISEMNQFIQKQQEQQKQQQPNIKDLIRGLDKEIKEAKAINEAKLEAAKARKGSGFLSRRGTSGKSEKAETRNRNSGAGPLPRVAQLKSEAPSPVTSRRSSFVFVSKSEKENLAKLQNQADVEKALLKLNNAELRQLMMNKYRDANAIVNVKDVKGLVRSMNRFPLLSHDYYEYLLDRHKLKNELALTQNNFPAEGFSLKEGIRSNEILALLNESSRPEGQEQLGEKKTLKRVLEEELNPKHDAERELQKGLHLMGEPKIVKIGGKAKATPEERLARRENNMLRAENLIEELMNKNERLNNQDFSNIEAIKRYAGEIILRYTDSSKGAGLVERVQQLFVKMDALEVKDKNFGVPKEKEEMNAELPVQSPKKIYPKVDFFYDKNNWAQYWNAYNNAVAGKDESKPHVRLEGHRNACRACNIPWDAVSKIIASTEMISNLYSNKQMYMPAFQAKFEDNLIKQEKENGRLDAEIEIKLNKGEFFTRFSQREMLDIVMPHLIHANNPMAREMMNALIKIVDFAEGVAKLDNKLSPLQKVEAIAQLLESKSPDYRKAFAEYSSVFQAALASLDEKSQQNLTQQLIAAKLLQPGLDANAFFMIPTQCVMRYQMAVNDLATMMQKNNADAHAIDNVRELGARLDNVVRGVDRLMPTQHDNFIQDLIGELKALDLGPDTERSQNVEALISQLRDLQLGEREVERSPTLKQIKEMLPAEQDMDLHLSQHNVADLLHALDSFSEHHDADAFLKELIHDLTSSSSLHPNSLLHDVETFSREIAQHKTSESYSAEEVLSKISNSLLAQRLIQEFNRNTGGSPLPDKKLLSEFVQDVNQALISGGMNRSKLAELLGSDKYAPEVSIMFKDRTAIFSRKSETFVHAVEMESVAAKAQAPRTPSPREK